MTTGAKTRELKNQENMCFTYKIKAFTLSLYTKISLEFFLKQLLSLLGDS